MQLIIGHDNFYTLFIRNLLSEAVATESNIYIVKLKPWCSINLVLLRGSENTALAQLSPIEGHLRLCVTCCRNAAFILPFSSRISHSLVAMAQNTSNIEELLKRPLYGMCDFSGNY